MEWSDEKKRERGEENREELIANLGEARRQVQDQGAGGGSRPSAGALQPKGEGRVYAKSSGMRSQSVLGNKTTLIHLKPSTGGRQLARCGNKARLPYLYQNQMLTENDLSRLLSECQYLQRQRSATTFSARRRHLSLTPGAGTTSRQLRAQLVVQLEQPSPRTQGTELMLPSLEEAKRRCERCWSSCESLRCPLVRRRRHLKL